MAIQGLAQHHEAHARLALALSHQGLVLLVCVRRKVRISHRILGKDSGRSDQLHACQD